MKVLSYICLFFIFIFTVTSELEARSDKFIQRIGFMGLYTGGLDLNTPVTGLSGMGAMLETRFRLYDRLTFSFYAGYSYLHVNQPDPIEWWEWDYWEIYYRNYLSVWTGEGIYTYEIDPQQRVELYPVLLTLNYEFPELLRRLSGSVSIGGGYFVFENRLFTNERWWKEFPNIDYVYEYSFSNHAPSKNGSLFGFVAGMNLTYRVSNILGINLSTNYNHIISSIRKDDFQIFPYTSSVNFVTGIVLFY